MTRVWIYGALESFAMSFFMESPHLRLKNILILTGGKYKAVELAFVSSWMGSALYLTKHKAYVGVYGLILVFMVLRVVLF